MGVFSNKWVSMKISFGIFFILVGITCNEWILAKFLSSDGVIGNSLNRFIIWAVDLAFVGFGLSILFSRRHNTKQILQNVGLAICSLLVCIVVLEIGFFYFFTHKTGYFVWPPNTKRTFNPNPSLIPGIRGMAEFKTNSWGIRGRDFSDEDSYRILTIGGSTTEGLYLDESETWPTKLEKYLNEISGIQVWVGNVGRSGMSAKEHILHVKYLPKDYPKIDAVIILVGVNDLLRWLANPDFLEDFDNEGKLLDRAFVMHPHFSYRSLLTYQMVERAYYKIDLLVNEPPQGFQEGSGEHFIDLRRKRHDSPKIDTIPDLSLALTVYKRNINKIIDLAQSKNVRIIFLTQPTMWRPDLNEKEKGFLWLGSKGYVFDPNVTEYYSVRALSFMMKKYNDTLLNVCRERGVECIDIASMLPQDTTIFYDDCHFNEDGSKKVTSIIGRYLSETGLFNSNRE